MVKCNGNLGDNLAMADLKNKIADLEAVAASRAQKLKEANRENIALRAKNSAMRKALKWSKPYVARLRDTEIIDNALSSCGSDV